MSTVTLSREKRATAGRRMTSLVGKAQEADEQFWSHDTWGEEHDEDYDIAEERQEDLVDVFDSDFNDSEEDEESGSGDDDARPAKRARTAPKSKWRLPLLETQGEASIMTTRLDPVIYPALHQRQQLLMIQARQRSLEAAASHRDDSHPRALLLKKKSKEKQKKSSMGSGLNAGVTLYVPSSSLELQTALDEWKALEEDYRQAVEKRQQATLESHKQSQQASSEPESALSKSQIPEPSDEEKKIEEVVLSKPVVTFSLPHSPVETKAPVVTSEDPTPLVAIAADVGRRNLRTKTLMSTIATASAQQDVSNPKSPIKDDKRFIPTQEEMLLEAVHTTELENAKWLHTRQRLAAQDATKINVAAKGLKTNNSGVILKLHSKRGCYNTITFSELDRIPDQWKALMASKTSKPIQPPENAPKLCFITQQPAKYRDPKTKLYYSNLDAYLELKRRYDAGTLFSSTDKSLLKKSSNKSIKPNRCTSEALASFNKIIVKVAGEILATLTMANENHSEAHINSVETHVPKLPPKALSVDPAPPIPVATFAKSEDPPHQSSSPRTASEVAEKIAAFNSTNPLNYAKLPPTSSCEDAKIPTISKINKKVGKSKKNHPDDCFATSVSTKASMVAEQQSSKPVEVNNHALDTLTCPIPPNVALPQDAIALDNSKFLQPALTNKSLQSSINSAELSKPPSQQRYVDRSLVKAVLDAYEDAYSRSRSNSIASEGPTL